MSNSSVQRDLGLDCEDSLLSIDALKYLSLIYSDSVSKDHLGCFVSNPVGSSSLGVLAEEFRLPVSSLGALVFCRLIKI